MFGVSFIDANNGTVVGGGFFCVTILRTIDGGTTWSSQTSDTTYSLSSVSFTDVNNGTAVGSGVLGGAILRTIDGGTTWTSQTSGTIRPLRGVSFTDANNGTAVGDFNTIRRTTDGGTTWTTQISGIPLGLALGAVSFTDANNGTAVGHEGSIIRTTNGGVTFVEEEEESTSPNVFSLYQNYPNPFNPTTTINYKISELGFVTLKVYDVLGNEIETLVNEEKSSGSYEVDFDASGLTSGIYFYKLQTGYFIDTKKMILLK